MTVYSTQNAVNDEKKEQKDVHMEVMFEPLPVKIGLDEQPEGDEEVEDAGLQLRMRTRRRRLCLQMTLLTFMVVGLSVSVLGTIYLYKHVNSQRYSGFCGVRYSMNDEYRYLDEEVDVQEQVETIKVPKFDEHDNATFVHDFYRNVTLIKDFTDAVCYVLPLDRQHIPAPLNFLEFLFRIARGDYIPDANVIQQEYSVVEPRVADTEEQFGTYISDLCVEYPTYRLKRIDNWTAGSTTTSPAVRKFGMYAGGDALIRYLIDI